ncbi:VOC family protein [Novosphingobium sp. BL-52-GroH]|uniref:VOC family protein n=1 Tax=Novosphingobium sp. BL-52-GroH TaxID=3349877 RepID=UPI00384BD89C
MDILGLGYLGLSSPSVEAWRDYATAVLGMEVAETRAGYDPETLYLRMDDREHRIAIRPAELDDIEYIGWEAKDRTAYRQVLQRLGERNVPFELGDANLVKLRGVREVARFKDPAGYQHEIFYGQRWHPDSFTSPRRGHKGFAAGPDGLGHVVLISPQPLEVIDEFFIGILGFEWFGYGFGGTNMTFLRTPLNGRSHSIAYAYVPGHKGLQHLGLAFNALDDVGITQDRVIERELKMQMTLGRHTNDPIISFYHFTPGQFPVECLWEEHPWIEANVGFEVNPTALSTWGHKVVGPMVGTTVRPLDSSATGSGPALRPVKDGKVAA